MRQGGRNNFTPLRLLLALLVFIAHYRWLAGEDYRSFSFPFIYGGFAVQGFFVVSGFLIAGSYARDPDLKRFYLRRFFRIYPLYVTVILAQTFILASLAPGGLALNALSLLRYLAVNAVFANFLQHDVGGVLAHLPDPSLNASLWTLKIEVAFYVMLPFLWRATERWGAGILAPIFLLSALYFESFTRAGYYDIAKQLPGQLQFFILGMAAFTYGEKIKLEKYTALGTTLVLGGIISIFITKQWQVPILYPLLVAICVLVMALRVPPLTLHTDISYGIYLFHAPLVQLSLLLGLYRPGWIGLGVTFAVLLALAFFAERFIEAPFIALGHRLTRKPAATTVHTYA